MLIDNAAPRSYKISSVFPNTLKISISQMNTLTLKPGLIDLLR
jgi:hypothetical protein